MQGPQASAHSIVAVHADGAARKVIAQALSASMRPVRLFASADEAEAALAHGADLIIVDAVAATTSVLAKAVAAGVKSCIVAMGPGHPEPSIPAGFHNLALTQPCGADASELLVTALKLLRDDVFGIEKYLSWTFVPLSREVSTSTQRHEVVNEIRNYILYRKLSSRLQWLAAQTADELLSNALFHAPVDETGKRIRASLRRTTAFELEPDERVRVRFGADERYLAIEVADQWGSLDLPALARSLRLTGGSDLAPDTGDGTGAGIGLALAAGYVSHLVCNVEPGRRTELIALFDLRRAGALAGLDGASFHAVVRRGEDA